MTPTLKVYKVHYVNGIDEICTKEVSAYSIGNAVHHVEQLNECKKVVGAIELGYQMRIN